MRAERERLEIPILYIRKLYACINFSFLAMTLGSFLEARRPISIGNNTVSNVMALSRITLLEDLFSFPKRAGVTNGYHELTSKELAQAANRNAWWLEKTQSARSLVRNNIIGGFE